MPYIKGDLERIRLYPVSQDRPNGPGDLNYQITMLIRQYLEQQGLSYLTCNEIVGALDNAKDEFRRRVLHPYEDQKIYVNGDVYENWIKINDR